MARLVPIDGDPFAAPRLTPVDFNPFDVAEIARRQNAAGTAPPPDPRDVAAEQRRLSRNQDIERGIEPDSGQTPEINRALNRIGAGHDAGGDRPFVYDRLHRSQERRQTFENAEAQPEDVRNTMVYIDTIRHNLNPQNFPWLYRVDQAQPVQLTEGEIADIVMRSRDEIAGMSPADATRYLFGARNVRPDRNVAASLGQEERPPAFQADMLDPGSGPDHDPITGRSRRERANMYDTISVPLSEEQKADILYQRQAGRYFRNPVQPTGPADAAYEHVSRDFQRLISGYDTVWATVAEEAGFHDSARLHQRWADLRTRASNRAIAGEVNSDDVWDHPTAANVSQFLAEQGLESTPEMATAILSLPIYTVSLAGQTAQQRSQSDHREYPDMTDVLVSLPTSVVSAALERMPLVNIIERRLGHTATQRILAGIATEGGTEFLQNPVQYAGGTIGTQEGFDPEEALKQGVLGALAGAGMGGGLAGGIEGAHGGLHAARGGDRGAAIREMGGARFDPAQTDAAAVTALNPNGYDPSDPTNIASLRSSVGAQSPLAPRLGIKEQAQATPPNVTPQDVASPLPTDLIAQGKKAAADALATTQADQLVGDNIGHGIGDHVAVTIGGQTRTGQIHDAFTEEDPETGTHHGAVIGWSDGTTTRERFSDLHDAGAQIRRTPLNEGDQPGRFAIAGGYTVGDGYGANRGDHVHHGVDMFARAGTPFPVGRPFDIVESHRQTSHGGIGGNIATVQFADGSEWIAAHLPDLPRAGHYEAGADVIRAGNTGSASATESHVHWQPVNELAHTIYNQGRRTVAAYLTGGAAPAGAVAGAETDAAGPAPDFSWIDRPVDQAGAPTPAAGENSTAQFSPISPEGDRGPPIGQDAPPAAEPVVDYHALWNSLRDGSISRDSIAASGVSPHLFTSNVVPAYTRGEINSPEELRSFVEQQMAPTSTDAAPVATTTPPQITVERSNAVIRNASESDIARVDAALPGNVRTIPRADGAFVAPKKYEEAIRTALIRDGTREAPITATTAEHVEQAAAQANPEPTEAQAAAGNYSKGHVRVQGLDISIENAKGSERSGVDPNGEPWTVTMPATYGYLKRSEGQDGEQVDVYVGDHPTAPTVYVIDQVHADTKAPDEHKAMIGFPSEEAAIATYHQAFSDGKGPDRVGAVTPMDMGQFKEWLKGDTTVPAAANVSATPASAPPARETAPEATGQPAPETGAPAASESFDPTPHIAALKEYVSRRGRSLAPEAVARAIGVAPEHAMHVVSALAAQPNSGVYVSKAGNARRVPAREGPVSLYHFLKDRGGIRDDSGHALSNKGRELANGVRRSGRGLNRFPGLINNKTGMPLDSALEAAVEAGYFDTHERQNYSINDLQQKLENASAEFRPEDTGAVMDREAGKAQTDAEKTMQADIREQAVGLAFTPDDSDAALRYMHDGYSAAEAVHAAMLDAAGETLDTLEQESGVDPYAAMKEAIYAGSSAEDRGDYSRNPNAADRGAAAGITGPEGQQGNAGQGGDANAESNGAGAARKPGEVATDLLGKPAEQPAPKAEAPTESQPDMLGTQPGDERRALERKGDGRKQSEATQKAPGSEGGLFDNNARQSDIEQTPIDQAKAALQSALDALNGKTPEAPVAEAAPAEVLPHDDLGTAAREAYARAHGDLWLKPLDQLDSLFEQAKLSEAAQLNRAIELIGFEPSERLSRMLETDHFIFDRAAALIEKEAEAAGKEIPAEADRIINPRWNDAPATSLPMSEDVEGLQRAHAAAADSDPHMVASEVGWALRDIDAERIRDVLNGHGDLQAQAAMATVRLGYERLKELGTRSDQIPAAIAGAMERNGVNPATADELTRSILDDLKQAGVRQLEAPKGVAEAAEQRVSPNEGQATEQTPPLSETDAKAIVGELERVLTNLDPNNRFTFYAAKGLLKNAQGAYLNRVAYVSLDRSYNPVATIIHEIGGHGFRDLGLYTNPEWTALGKDAKERGYMDWAKRHYPTAPTAKQEEEAISEMIATFVSRRNETKGFVRTALQKVGDFVDALIDAIRTWRTGNPQARQIMRQIESGKIGARPAGFGLDGAPRASVEPQGAALFQQRTPATIWNDQLNYARDLTGAAKTIGKKDKIAAAFDRFRINFQDRVLPLLRTQTAIERVIGRPLTEEEQPYRQEALYTGRVGDQFEKLADNIVEPMFEAMKENGVTSDELESYLYARHAPERNAKLEKEGVQDGSGMSDVEAAAILSRIEKAGKTEALKNAATWFDKLNSFAMETRIAGGLMNQEQADEWKSIYPNYAPLRGQRELPEEERPNMGQSGFSVKGPESRRAFGRKSLADDILAHAIVQAQEAVVRAEKNRVATELYNLAKANPDPNFWEIQKVTMKKRINKDTGMIESYAVTQATADDMKYTVNLKVNGKAQRVTFNRHNPAAVRAAEAMRRMNEPERNFKIFQMINGYLSKVNTTLSPDFIVSNIARDLETATANLSGFDIKGLRRDVLASWPKAFAAAERGAFKREGVNEWDQAWKDYSANGGRIAFNQIESVDQLRKDIAKRFSQASNLSPKQAGLKAWEGLKWTFDKIEKANMGAENATRLSVYKSLVDRGVSQKQAAFIAKEITTNFNRRGVYGALVNSLYLFANASIQGNARMIMALKHRRTQKIAGSMIVAGALVAMFNAAFGGDDDDGVPYYDKISDFEKANNLIFMLPGTGGHYIKIPMAYGYNIFPDLGRRTVDVIRGRAHAIDAGWGWLSNALNSFNPIGGQESVANFLAPTTADPAVDLLVDNRDFADRPIMPEQPAFGPPVPDSQRFWPSIPPYYRALTDALNRATGGDQVRPGSVLGVDTSVSPETLQYLVGQATGSAGATVGRIASVATKAFDGDPETNVELNDIPIVRRLVGAKPSWYDRAAFNARLHSVQEMVEQDREYHRLGDQQGQRNFVAEHRDVLELHAAANQAQHEMQMIRRAKAQAEIAYDAGRITRARYDQIRTAAAAREERLFAAFNLVYLRQVHDPVQPER